jgi:hypothetical protein
MIGIENDSAPAVPTVGEWAALLAREGVLLGELLAAVARQRDAVAHDRAADVQASTDDMQGILYMLERSRRRAAELSDSLAPGGTPPAELEPTVRALRLAALRVRREAGVNRDCLRACIANGEAFLQQLFSSLDTAPAYGPAERREEPVPTGRVLDRRV